MDDGLQKKDAEGPTGQKDDGQENVDEGLKVDKDEGLQKDGNKELNEVLNAESEDTYL